ncbi:hypothetical protein H2200_001309 [Cladophialophora chaetospira]|uniref:Uncharacterized protein n=1 Tax=Cladophialophora chaetospira TaxID=386627 RepID=A0AA39CPH2_9EURO|nr:hypothetical protein H2200_001309 [Cladophialophora chaetospira]
MASARLIQTAAAMAPPLKRQYTVILATSHHASPTFLHQVQQSSLSPLFVGEHSVFFRKTHLSDWGWSHIFLFAGEDVKFDPVFNIRQSWSFTVDAIEEIAMDETFDAEVMDQHGLMRASGCGVEEPQDLAESLKYWFRPRTNRLWVLTFLDFARPDAQGRYEEHLVESKEQYGLKVHLFGKGSRSMRAFLMSEEHRRLVKLAEKDGEGVSKEEAGLAGVVEESMILTKELRLPSRDQVINRYEWHDGNPYEPFGMDFFG